MTRTSRDILLIAEEPALNPGRPFKDPAAEVVWAALCVLPDGAQHELAAQLADRLSLLEADRPGPDHRRARGVAALREAARILNHSPSVGEYRALRDGHPEYGWPPDGSLRRWLSEAGSWNGALVEARLAALPDPQPETEGHGPELSDAEIEAAVAECSVEFGKPVAELSFSHYLTWSRQPAVRRRPGRRPRSQIPFDRLGGWREVKRRVIGGDAGDAERAIVAAGADGHGYRYTDEEIFAAAEEIIARLGGKTDWPTIAQWGRERKAILAEERERGVPPRAIPGAGVLQERFGRWLQARHFYEEARKA